MTSFQSNTLVAVVGAHKHRHRTVQRIFSCSAITAAACTETDLTLGFKGVEKFFFR
jgi:hypothetical protein